jgi:hypothetical protein
MLLSETAIAFSQPGISDYILLGQETRMHKTAALFSFNSSGDTHLELVE